MGSAYTQYSVFGENTSNVSPFRGIPMEKANTIQFEMEW